MILIKENILPESTQAMVHDEIEFLSVTFNNLTVTSIYKPPSVKLSFPDNFFNFDCNNIIIGDLNCHNHIWGYNDSDDNGIYLAEWLTANQLFLTHDPKQPAMFNSSRWKRGYNPNSFTTSTTRTSHQACNNIDRTTFPQTFQTSKGEMG